MPEYRRIDAPGATVFFTVVTDGRRPMFMTPAAIALLRWAFRQVRSAHPFEFDAVVILPDHLHAIWTLPAGDHDFSKRWSLIKRAFTQRFLAAGARESVRSTSRRRRGERSVWQRRFWDHVIRDDDDLDRHMNYIHYNPVKHGLSTCPHAWSHSSFAKWVQRGVYPQDWCCVCDNRVFKPPAVPKIVMGE